MNQRSSKDFLESVWDSNDARQYIESNFTKDESKSIKRFLEGAGSDAHQYLESNFTEEELEVSGRFLEGVWLARYNDQKYVASNFTKDELNALFKRFKDKAIPLK